MFAGPWKGGGARLPADRGAVLVTGASGFIGRALIARLALEGEHVIAVTRDPHAPFPPGVSIRQADLAAGTGVAGLADGVTRIFHCAGEIRNVAAMHALHVDGTARLLGAISDRGVSGIHWVQLSSVGAYGPAAAPGAVRRVDEETEERPAGEYETTKTKSDGLVREAAAEGLITFAMLRPSGVIGASMSNASLHGLIAMIRRGWFFHVGPEGAIANYVHVDDVVEGLLLCARHPAAAGRHFNLSSDCAWVALADEIAAIAGVKRPRLRVPAAPVRAIAHAASALRLPLTPARVNALMNRTRYPPDRIQSILGFRFSRPMPAAVRDLMEAA